MYIAIGDLTSAERDFDSAIDLLEQQHDALTLPWKISFFARVWQVFDDAIALQAFRLRRPDRALEIAERHKARTRLAGAHTSRTSAARSPLVARVDLPAETAVLFYVVLDKTLLVWLVTRDEIHFREVPIDLVQFNALIDRYLLLFQTDAAGPEIAALSRDLYTHVVQPHRQELLAYRNLVIVPDRRLHDIPFGHLQDPSNGRLLIEDHAITVSPSLTNFLEATAALSRKPRQSSIQMLVVAGAPLPGTVVGQVNDLPGARREVVNVVRRYADSVELLEGQTATEQRFRHAAPRADIVHFAGHGMANIQRPLMSRLVLTPERGVDDGNLFAFELRTIDLSRTRLAVLAACQSAAGGDARGEEVVSLAHALLSAGAPIVVAGLWKVRDDASRELFEAFYDAIQSGAAPQEALRSAQLSLLARSKTDPALADTWPAFMTIGGAAPAMPFSSPRHPSHR